MGLGDMDLVDDGGGGGGGPEAAAAAAVSCSVCLDVVTDNGERSWAKLQCGHQFHLDCIGSAFNSKGAMQCPNCRKIEKGQWLYASGSRPLPDLNMEDWAHDEDLYDLSYSEMSFGVHWCPFNGLTRLASHFEDGDFSPSTYHDLLGHQAIFAEHATVSTTSHPCPYIAYVGPVHPSSSASSGNFADGSSFTSYWSGPLRTEVPSSFAFPSMDVRYHNWEQSPPFAANGRTGGSDQSSVPAATQRTARSSPDMARPGIHPYFFGHSSAGRAPSSVLPTYPGGVPRPRDRSPSLQAYFQQSASNLATRTPPIPRGERSNSRRGLAQVSPMASSSDQSIGFYLFSSSSSGRTLQEGEAQPHDQFHGWNQEHQPSFALNSADTGPVWGTFAPPPTGPNTRIRSSGFRQRYGSERMPSHNRS